MENSKYTRGPWTVGNPEGSEGRIYIMVGGHTEISIIQVPSEMHGSNYEIESYEERMANARLIAAAPDLLEACKVMVSYVKSLDKIPCISNAMESVGTALKAIAKAEGRD